MLAILLGLLLLVAAAAGAYMLLHNSKAQDTATTTTQKHDIAQLTVGVAGGEITLDPLSGAHDSYLQAINMQVFESLVQYKDNTKLVPLLATGWSNPNNDTWVFNLRPNVLFHDGNTMTAADVAYSMKLAAADPDLSTTYASTIKDARALSGNRVEITTKQTDPFFLNRLSFLKVIDSKKPSVTDGSNGTGPYQLKAGTKPSDTTISLTAFNRYHAGHVYTKALTYIAEADEDSLSKDLKAGKVQFAGEYSSTKPDGVNVANYQSWTVSDPAVTFLALNSVASGPLQKLEVRQALRDSIDIPTMIKDLDLSAVPASQLMTKDIPGYNESLSVPKQDIVKAKSLLTTAGYPNGVSLTLSVTAANKKISEEIATQAKAAGFNITFKEEPDFDTLIGKVLGGKTELSAISFSSDVLDGSDVFTQVIQQTGNYKSTTLNDYLKQANSTIDQADRLQVLQKTSKYLNDDVAAIPLFDRQRTWLTSNDYHLKFDTNTAVPGVYFWQVYSTK